MLDLSCLGPCTGSCRTGRAMMPSIFGWLICEKQCPASAPYLLLMACTAFGLGELLSRRITENALSPTRTERLVPLPTQSSGQQLSFGTLTKRHSRSLDCLVCLPLLFANLSLFPRDSRRPSSLLPLWLGKRLHSLNCARHLPARCGDSLCCPHPY